MKQELAIQSVYSPRNYSWFSTISMLYRVQAPGATETVGLPFTNSRLPSFQVASLTSRCTHRGTFPSFPKDLSTISMLYRVQAPGATETAGLPSTNSRLPSFRVVSLTSLCTHRGTFPSFPTDSSTVSMLNRVQAPGATETIGLPSTNSRLPSFRVASLTSLCTHRGTFPSFPTDSSTVSMLNRVQAPEATETIGLPSTNSRLPSFLSG